jgi:hypothetical protein
MSILLTFIYNLYFILSSFFKNKYVSGISILVWAGGLLGFIIEFKRCKNSSEEKKRGLFLLALFILGTGISILKGGAAYSHYVIQLIPFMCILSAAFLDINLLSRLKGITVTTLSLALLISFHPITKQYILLASRILTNQNITYGSAYEIAEYLKQEDNLDNNLYIMSEDHIAYWLTNSMPMNAITVHPANISQEFILDSLVGDKTTTEKEIAKILDQKPKFIVKKKNVWYLKNKEEAKLLLENTLENEYELVKEIQVKEIQETQIYRRI